MARGFREWKMEDPVSLKMLSHAGNSPFSSAVHGLYIMSLSSFSEIGTLSGEGIIIILWKMKLSEKRFLSKIQVVGGECKIKKVESCRR